MTDWTGDIKLLALIDSGVSFIFKSSLVAKFLGWVVRPNTTLVSVKLANGVVVHASGSSGGLVLSGVW